MDLSISQKYLLCVLNKKGKLSTFDTGVGACLLAGCLFDLMFCDSVKIAKDKKIYVSSELDSNLKYLESLYSYLKVSKPMKAEKLVSDYFFGFSDKKKNRIVYDLGMSLADMGIVTYKKGGLFGNTDFFFPKKEHVDRIIENIRAELLEDGTVSEDMVALVSLLEKSNQIKRYFSAYEKDKLKIRLKEIRESDAHKVVKEMVDYIDGMIAVFVAISSTN